jgi:hypothetical protein
MLKLIGSFFALALLSACATSFTGSAHVQGGRAGCETKCSVQGLTMSGLVYLGEYSTACVCSLRPAAPVPAAPAPAAPPTQAPAAPPVGQLDMDEAVAAVGGAAAGVIMEKQSQELTRNQTIAY